MLSWILPPLLWHPLIAMKTYSCNTLSHIALRPVSDGGLVAEEGVKNIIDYEIASNKCDF